MAEYYAKAVIKDAEFRIKPLEHISNAVAGARLKCIKEEGKNQIFVPLKSGVLVKKRGVMVDEQAHNIKRMADTQRNEDSIRRHIEIARQIDVPRPEVTGECMSAFEKRFYEYIKREGDLKPNAPSLIEIRPKLNEKNKVIGFLIGPQKPGTKGN